MYFKAKQRSMAENMPCRPRAAGYETGSKTRETMRNGKKETLMKSSEKGFQKGAASKQQVREKEMAR